MAQILLYKQQQNLLDVDNTEFLLDVAHVQTDKVARTDNLCRLLVRLRYLFLF